MPEAPRWIAMLVGAVAVAASLVLAAPAAAQEAGVDLGAYGVPLRFEAPQGTTFEVADTGRYVDVLELRLFGGELVLVNELGFDDYVAGIHEMPARWPMEALKAQAVAARTYAWRALRRGAHQARGYDICATTACQVFAGRRVVETPLVGQRWQAAVDATSGEVLLYDGQPILARYFSTSGGSTRNNEHVFPSEGAYPYLLAVEDPHDAVSPLHEWQVRFPRDDMDAILARGETLQDAVPAVAFGVVPADGQRTDLVRVTRADGHQVEVGASAFRHFVSTVAPDISDRYPTLRADGEARLPATLPSSRFAFTVTETEVIVDGRGWGHGVGMSQWGAMGQAENGAAYDEILHHYYQGVDLASATALPDRIRVGVREVARGSFDLRADGPFRVVAGGTEVTARGLGTWTVAVRPDRTMQLTAPEGYGAPLVVSPTETSRDRPSPFEVVALETVVNKPAELFVEVAAGGATVARQPAGIVDAGRHAVDWSLDGEPAQVLAAGRYDVRLVAVDEDGVEAGEPASVEIRELATPAALQSLLGPAPDPPVAGGWPLAVVALLGAAAGAAAAALVPVRA